MLPVPGEPIDKLTFLTLPMDTLLAIPMLGDNLYTLIFHAGCLGENWRTEKWGDETKFHPRLAPAGTRCEHHGCKYARQEVNRAATG